MIKGVVTFYENTGTAPLAVTIGTAEDIKAPRDLAALEKQGWITDSNEFTMTYKAWLAGKRQGDIPADSKFLDWVDTVQEFDLKPTRKQIEQAVLVGQMTQEQADGLLKAIEVEEGEA